MQLCVFVVRTTIDIFEIQVSGKSATALFFFLSKLSISEHSSSIGICIKKGKKTFQSELSGHVRSKVEFFDALPNYVLRVGQIVFTKRVYTQETFFIKPLYLMILLKPTSIYDRQRGPFEFSSLCKLTFSLVITHSSSH